MQCIVKTPSTWKENAQGTPEVNTITIKIYSLTGTTTFSNTKITVFGENLVFKDFDVSSGPQPTSNANLGGLNWEAKFQGAPTFSNPWTIVVTATKRAGIFGTDAATLRVFGGATYFTTIEELDSFNKEIRINLADANGALGKPIKPKRFRAKATGAVATALTWAKVDYADEIVVERATNSAFTGTVHEWRIGGSETSYVDFKTSGIVSTVPDLLPATQYFYRIHGENSMGEGPVSDTADATTVATPDNPEPPENVRAIKSSGTEITIGFDPISDLVVKTADGKVTLKPSYQASYSSVQGGPYTAFDVYKEGKNIKVSGLSPNTTYYFVVRSSYTYAPAAVSANSDEADATTENLAGAAATPTGFAVSVITGTFVNVRAIWNNNNNSQATYDLFRAAGAATNPYTLVANDLPSSSTSYDDIGLSASTQYFYRLRAQNSVGPSAYATANVTTNAFPAAPNTPADLAAAPTSDASIALDILLDVAGTTPTHIDIYRATVSGGPYTKVGEMAAPTVGVLYHYVDSNGLEQNATYYYVARSRNAGGASANSTEASATTFRRSSTSNPQSNFSFSPDSKTNVIQVGSRAVFISDLDRMVVFTNRGWFLGGLKRQLNAPTLVAVTPMSGGGLFPSGSDKVFTVFTVLYSSKRSTRSLPSEGADVTVSAGETIRITPDIGTSGSADIVLVRDVAYDSANNQILAADYVEFYIASDTSTNAYLVATIPVNDPLWDLPGYYELPGDLTSKEIFGSERRPMELLGESSLPPACSQGYAKDNRLILFGERTFTPSAEETLAGAEVSINTGDHTFTVTNYTLSDGMIYHELYLNGNPTGWEIYDIEDDTAYIRHADPDINEQGYRGLGGAFSDFNLVARASRVYYSAFFTGEANGATTYSPETFPPLTHFEAEFFPQDNTDPNSIITSNSDLIVGKPSKMMLVRGGSEPDFPLISVISLSQSSGLNAPKTICRDSRDTVFYLGDTGPFAVSASGVQKMNVQSGNQNLFTQVFDINSVANSVGTWYSQQDWFVVAHLNKIGNSGFKDGFIYDPNLELICPFSTPYEITWIQEAKNIFGTYQILFGDSAGRLGILFKPGLSADGIDYSIAAPSVFATPISGYMRGQIMQTQNRITVRSFQPQIFMQNGATAQCKFSVARKDRMDDPFAFNPQKVVQFDTDDTRTYFSVASHSYPNAVVQFDFTLPVNPTDARMSWREIVLELVTRGPL